MKRTSKGLFTGLVLSLASGCWTAPRALVRLGPTDAGVFVSGLSSCHPESSGPVVLDATKPIILLVHGCNFSGGGFRTLASVFEAHGQQTICFNYNDRDELEESSAQLLSALGALERYIGPQRITVLGHSQGGLVARRALAKGRGISADASQRFSYRLVTVSSPFGGIAASRHCGLKWLHVATLGVTMAVCQAIAGSKWTEIYPGSDFMNHPGELDESVTTHLKIVTDERGTCRRQRADGSCAEGDLVFTVDEQYNDAVDANPLVAGVQVQAGHVEIVGEQGTPPMKLIHILQDERVMVQTPAERRDEIAALLRRIY